MKIYEESMLLVKSNKPFLQQDIYKWCTVCTTVIIMFNTCSVPRNTSEIMQDGHLVMIRIFVICLGGNMQLLLLFLLIFIVNCNDRDSRSGWLTIDKLNLRFF